MNTHSEIIESVTNDLGGVRLMNSANCSQAVWTAKEIEDPEIKALVERIINSCACGSVYDWAIGKFIIKVGSPS